MRGKLNRRITVAAMVIGSLTIPALAGDTVGLPAPTEGAEGAFPSQKHFSPYAGRNFPTQVFWGDTHLHTGMSFDAGSFGCRLGPEDAYRFARGEELTSSTGLQVKLSRPLDFLVVADHSDNMGFFPRLFSGDPEMLADPTGKRWYEMVQEGGQEGVAAAIEIIEAFSQGTFPEALASPPGSEAYRSAWEETIDAAEKYNDPGRFTAFIGYEWTSNTGGNNLHRVVIYRGDGDEARVTEPYTTLQPAGSDNPRDLWRWMASYQERTGGRLLAIPHNGNLSNGIMFPIVDSFTGQSFDRAYAETRMKWEPLYEATQIKGDGETHPLLSPDDEFADYETWDQGNLDLSVKKKDEMLQYEYARTALQTGLQLERELGVNPYKFGMIGSTDSHTALATAEEENFFGKHSGTEPSPARYKHPMAETANGRYESWDMVGSGLAAVWARENTREAIFDAMMRKETYATTGPRMLVRFFGGWEFEEADARSRLPGQIGYTKGVPMGGDLKNAPDGIAPSFLVAALKDPYSGNLDRIQIVKGWVDVDGGRHEKVYEAVWSGDRTPGADARSRLPGQIGYTKGVPMGGDLRNAPDGIAPSFLVAALKDPYSGNLDRIQIVKGWVDADGGRHEKVYDAVWSGDRAPGADGKLPPVGNTVDVANATWTNTIGAPELITVWRDPDFDADLPAVYYARVLEIPTPRWTAYEAQRFGITLPPEAEMITQERAYTSPIWYTP